MGLEYGKLINESPKKTIIEIDKKNIRGLKLLFKALKTRNKTERKIDKYKKDPNKPISVAYWRKSLWL